MIEKSLLFVPGRLPLATPILCQEKKGQTAPPVLRHEIVVSATRVETPAKEIASSITVITRLDLEKSKKSTVLELLQDVLGAAVIQNGGKGSASSTLLGGSNSEHVLVMLDGVELNDPMNPSRSYDLAHFSLDNIEQIEILRGPQSTLYGSDALGGVVNILTKRGRGKPRFTLSSSGGSYNTLQTAAGLSGSGQSVHYSLGLSRFATGGISAASTGYPGNTEKDGYKNLSLSGRLGVSLKEKYRSGYHLSLRHGPDRHRWLRRALRGRPEQHPGLSLVLHAGPAPRALGGQPLGTKAGRLLYPFRSAERKSRR